MKKITKTFELYSFGELSDDVKQIVIDNYYQFLDYPYLDDDIILEIINNFDYKGVFSNIVLDYSLNHCQGDGLSFSADFDFEKFLSTYNIQGFKKRALLSAFNVDIVDNDGSHTYASREYIYFTDKYDCTSNSKLNLLNELFKSILSDIKDYYMLVCEKAENYGYYLVDYRMNFNEFEDFSYEYEKHYLANGDLYLFELEDNNTI